MHCFWSKGYEATSLTDLVEATGLLKGSLYRAFGDKHALFTQSLDRYLATMRVTVRRTLEDAATPVGGIRTALHRVIDIADADSREPRGCMAINSLIELVPNNAEVRALMLAHRKHVRGLLVDKLVEARAAGELVTQRDPDEAVALLMTFVAGLAATMKGPLSKADAHRLLDVQMDAVL